MGMVPYNSRCPYAKSYGWGLQVRGYKCKFDGRYCTLGYFPGWERRCPRADKLKLFLNLGEKHRKKWYEKIFRRGSNKVSTDSYETCKS